MISDDLLSFSARRFRELFRVDNVSANGACDLRMLRILLVFGAADSGDGGAHQAYAISWLVEWFEGEQEPGLLLNVAYSESPVQRPCYSVP